MTCSRITHVYGMLRGDQRTPMPVSNGAFRVSCPFPSYAPHTCPYLVNKPFLFLTLTTQSSPISNYEAAFITMVFSLYRTGRISSGSGAVIFLPLQVLLSFQATRFIQDQANQSGPKYGSVRIIEQGGQVEIHTERGHNTSSRRHLPISSGQKKKNYYGNSPPQCSSLR